MAGAQIDTPKEGEEFHRFMSLENQWHQLEPHGPNQVVALAPIFALDRLQSHTDSPTLYVELQRLSKDQPLNQTQPLMHVLKPQPQTAADNRAEQLEQAVLCHRDHSAHRRRCCQP